MRAYSGFCLSVSVTAILLTGSASIAAAQECGDVDDSGSIVTTDALLVLRRAVGQQVALMCPAGGLVAGSDPILAQSGQMTCYDAANAPVACAGTGQDGEVQAGQAPAFTNNGDGTITGGATGLMWEAKCDGASCGALHDMDTTYRWDEAVTSHVAMLNSTSFAGHTDWRLPNVVELQSLVNYETSSPAAHAALNACAADCDVTSCSCTAQGSHWSSTTAAFNPSTAWGVNFGNGNGVNAGKNNVFRVRAVRGGL